MIGQINIQEWEQNEGIFRHARLKVYHMDYFSEKNELSWYSTKTKIQERTGIQEAITNKENKNLYS